MVFPLGWIPSDAAKPRWVAGYALPDTNVADIVNETPGLGSLVGVQPSPSAADHRHGIPGYSNILINGGFKITQRGSTFTTPANNAYTLDRWQVQIGAGSSFGTVQQNSTNGVSAGGLAGRAVYCASGSYTHGGNASLFIQPILFADGVNYNLRGIPLTYSAWVFSSVANAFGLLAVSDGTGPVSTLTNAPAGLWTRLSTTFTIPNNATFLNVGLQFSATVATWGIAEAQLSEGPFQTPYTDLSAADDLARCMRYYQRWQPGGAGAYIAQGSAGSATAQFYLLPHRMPFGGTPTFTVSNPLDWNSVNETLAAAISCNSFSVVASNTISTFLSTASGVFGTAGTPRFLQSANANSYIALEWNP